MSAQQARTGGCACGAVRYRLDAPPFDAGYCHCDLCRRASGAPLLAFASVPADAFVLVSGTPGKWQSTSFGERWFCRDCGTQLAMRVDHQPDTVDFTLGSLDHPELVSPGFHIFFASRPCWFDVRDELPRHPRFRPDTRGLGGTGPADA